jgi:hypothetical protein
MERGSAASAMAVELTAGLLFATAVSDALGFASISFLLLLVGVPVCATAGLVCLARRVEADRDPLGTLQSALAGILLALFIVGAAARAPMTAEGIPAVGSGALALAFLVLLCQALVALAARPLRE